MTLNGVMTADRPALSQLLAVAG